MAYNNPYKAKMGKIKYIVTCYQADDPEGPCYTNHYKWWIGAVLNGVIADFFKGLICEDFEVMRMVRYQIERIRAKQ